MVSKLPGEFPFFLKYYDFDCNPKLIHKISNLLWERYTSSVAVSFFQVKGSNEKWYMVSSSSFYCSCPSFTFQFLKKKSSYLCKHVLATFLYKGDVATIADDELTSFLTSCFDTWHHMTTLQTPRETFSRVFPSNKVLNFLQGKTREKVSLGERV